MISKWIVSAGLLGAFSPCYAVMMPEKVAEDLKLRNALQKPPVSALVKEILPLLDRFEFRVISRSHSEISEDQPALQTLDMAFRHIFASVEPQTLISYRNLFFGYDDLSVSWGLKRNGFVEPNNPFFASEARGRNQFHVQLAPELKATPILAQAVKLAAIMDLDLRRQMMSMFGEAVEFRHYYPKMKLLSQIYSSVALWSAVQLLPPEVLRGELMELAKRLKTSVNPEHPALAPVLHPHDLYLELHALSEWLEEDNLGDWMLASLQDAAPHHEEDSDAFATLVDQILVRVQQGVEQQVWGEEAANKLTLQMGPALQAWWKTVPRQKKLSLEVEAQRKMDQLFKDVLPLDGIRVGSWCEKFLKSK